MYTFVPVITVGGYEVESVEPSAFRNCADVPEVLTNEPAVTEEAEIAVELASKPTTGALLGPLTVMGPVPDTEATFPVGPRGPVGPIGPVAPTTACTQADPSQYFNWLMEYPLV
jgi:hypothetical protein